jgi:hypothetical protein
VHRPAIYWPRMWLTEFVAVQIGFACESKGRRRQSETRNELETPDGGAMDADRVHCVGHRWRDLHLAYRRSQAEINLSYAAGAKEVCRLTNQPKRDKRHADQIELPD